MRSGELTRIGIGGSEVAAILGFDERRDQFTVWAEKKGGLTRMEATPRMRLGKLFERGIAEYYSELTSREIVWLDETQRHPVREWHVFTPDAVCANERRGLDCKLVGWDQRRHWGETVDEIPPRVRLQCLWYMAGMDYPLWDVVALLGMEEPRIWTLERDLEMEAAVIEQVERFYVDFILGDREPRIGGAAENARWLKERFPRALSPLAAPNPEQAKLLEMYTCLRIEEKPIKDHFKAARAELENAIKREIADGEGFVWADGKFTWRNTRDTERVDWEPLARVFMQGFTPEAQKLYIQEFTHTVPGQRRMYFHCSGLADD